MAFCLYSVYTPEKAIAPHSSTLAWRIPWMEEPGRLQSMGSRSQTPSDFTFTFHFHALEKEMATHSSILAWRIPGTGEPGGLPSMGSHRVRHNWSNLAAAADYTPIWGRWDFFSKRNFQDYKSICRYQSSLTPKASEKWCSVCSFHYFCFLMMETYNKMYRELFLCWP